MSVVEGIRRMVAAGLSLDDALSIAAEFEAAPAPQSSEPTARQLRNKRYYENRRKTREASETVLTGDLKASELASYSASEKDDLLAPLARVEDKSQIQRKEPLVKKGKIEGPKTPRDFLETVLDPEHAGHVLDHRQRMRLPLTAHAADLLARELAKCPDPNAGADFMISKAWRGFKIEWWESERQRAGPGQRQSTETTLQRRARELAERIENEHGIRRETGGDHPNDERVSLRLEDHRRDR